MVPSFRFYGTMRLLKFIFLSKIFQRLQRFPPSIFLKFCNRMLVKKSQRAPSTVFGIVRMFKMNNFRLKIRFSEAQHAISEFFWRPAFFLCYFFLSCFHRSPPPQFLLKMKRFGSIKGLLKVFGTMRLTGDLFQKNFRKISNFFPYFSAFLKMFPVEKDGFFVVSSWKNGFRDLCVSLRVLFGAVKLMKF